MRSDAVPTLCAKPTVSPNIHDYETRRSGNRGHDPKNIQREGEGFLPCRQSRHISSFSVYTLMFHGSMFSTWTFLFFKYFSSILYGCRAPDAVRRSVITTTGPLEVSGFTAGASEEGPRASDSIRVSVVGGAGSTACESTCAAIWADWDSLGNDCDSNSGCD